MENEKVDGAPRCDGCFWYDKRSDAQGGCLVDPPKMFMVPAQATPANPLGIGFQALVPIVAGAGRCRHHEPLPRPDDLVVARGVPESNVGGEDRPRPDDDRGGIYPYQPGDR